MKKGWFVLGLLVALQSVAQEKQKYKIVIGVIMDQFRYDYIDRYEPYFLPGTKKSGGFKRLMKNGAFLAQARYNHSGTYTAPGHSTYYSGLLPFQTRIIANEWYDRSFGKDIYCVSDSTVFGVGIDPKARAGRMSPRNYDGNTLADIWKERYPTSKSYAVAIKDRGSILGAGVKANGAFWFDVETGQWITSTYYYPDGNLPAWLTAFNAKKLPESYLGKKWELLLPERKYYLPDSARAEGYIPCEKTINFPHTLHAGCDGKNKPSPRYSAVAPTPFGNELTLEMAKAVLEGEKLGQNGQTDFLGISFSSTDYCGHIFGPDSREEMDMVIRLDRQLDAFFKYLDRTVGFDNCLFYFSADHGVCPIPEQTSDGIRISPEKFLEFIKIKTQSDFPEAILGFHNDQIYLDEAKILQQGRNVEEAEYFIGKMALLYPGIVAYYPKGLFNSAPTNDSLASMVYHSFDKQRSGNIQLILQPHAFFGSQKTGTTHGSPYEYDIHVPVLLCGPGIKKGRFEENVKIIDVFPTLATLLEIPVPANRKGKSLYFVLETKK